MSLNKLFFDENLPIEKNEPVKFLRGGGRYEGKRFIFQIYLESAMQNFYREFSGENFISLIISDYRHPKNLDYSHSLFINRREKWPENLKRSESFLTECEWLGKFNLGFTLSESQLKSIAFACPNSSTQYIKFELASRNNVFGLFRYQENQSSELVNWISGKPEETNSKKYKDIF